MPTEDGMITDVIPDVEDRRRRVEIEKIRAAVATRHGHNLSRDAIIGALKRLNYHPAAIGNEAWEPGRYKEPVSREIGR